MRRDLYVWSDAPEARVIAREGTIVYERIGRAVYRTQGGPRKPYCWAALWDKSQAARRLRGELGKPHPAAERYDDFDW